MKAESAGSSNAWRVGALTEPRAQPRKVSSVAEVSFQPKTAAVAEIW